ncbi:MAG: hypothetical protein C5B49_01920 [Bdellovibrio sp.]|nr:MAG: hypothetical protein C5B49_01920 [Bdellovibrio sp.]
MKQPGYWYFSQDDVLFIVYPDGQVEISCEGEWGPIWKFVSRNDAQYWHRNGLQFGDEFVGEL